MPTAPESQVGNQSLLLETKPDAEKAIARVEAWYEQEIIDRAPVRFSRHNALYDSADAETQARYPSLRDWWFDVDMQVERFLRKVDDKRYLGETFPVFWPNLGPNVFAACYGSELEFGEVTSWAEPILKDYTQPLALNWESPYLKAIEAQTRLALEHADGRFLVGYTDIHPGMDWVAALRGTQEMLFDLYDEPESILHLLEQATHDFHPFYDYFDAILKQAGQPSVTWMEIPSFGRMHIPSCDFSTMISHEHFETFALPALISECAAMTHNIFHVDGKGVARHLDEIMAIPNVHAIQWVQGVADDMPILQWVPLIQRIQKAGLSVVVDLQMDELEPFMDQVRPEGIYLCIGTESEEQEHAIIDRLLRWR